jgi:hypothetical protein
MQWGRVLSKLAVFTPSPPLPIKTLSPVLCYRYNTLPDRQPTDTNWSVTAIVEDLLILTLWTDDRFSRPAFHTLTEPCAAWK